LLAAFFAGGALMFGIGLSPLWILALVLVVAEGICEGLATVAEQGILQRRTPDEVRSRVVGALEAATLLALAVSLTLGGPIVDALGPRAAYHVGGMTTILAALVILRPMRHPGLPPHQADAAFEHPPASSVRAPRTSGDPSDERARARSGSPAEAPVAPSAS
jgi:MFS family permease